MALPGDAFVCKLVPVGEHRYSIARVRGAAILGEAVAYSAGAPVVAEGLTEDAAVSEDGGLVDR